MAYQLPFPAWLEKVDFVRIDFQLELTESFDLPSMALLQLRRELLLALKDMEPEQSAELVSGLNRLLSPPLPSDPVIKCQVQKPSPPLVLTVDCRLAGLLDTGAQMTLSTLFVGDGIAQIDPFVILLRSLGERGLVKGQGRFRIHAIAAITADDSRIELAKDAAFLTPPVTPLAWWLEQQALPSESLRLEIVTPMRLIKNGKPLFKACFSDLFPFILRRVSSLLVSHGQLEMELNQRSLFDHHQLLALADQVDVVENKLVWQDWRTLLRGEKARQDLGGLSGELLLAGAVLEDLSWLLQLGALFHVGKGAAYGAGQYRLLSG